MAVWTGCFNNTFVHWNKKMSITTKPPQDERTLYTVFSRYLMRRKHKHRRCGFRHTRRQPTDWDARRSTFTDNDYLNGDLAYSAGPESIEASYSENSVQVCFHQSFGNVNITLTCDTGSVVYNNTVNTSVQRSIHIPLPCTPSGRYTLMINNANGYAEGDFVR